MTFSFDYYFSFRSPYSYLALPQIVGLAATYDASPRMRIVTPIAIRIPGFFKQVNPLWPPYLMRDTMRIAEMNSIPYRWPRPDPIVMDIGTGEVAADQPYIHRVSRLGVAAQRAGKGLAFVHAAARKIWSGAIDNWHEGPHLADAAREAGLDPAALDAAVAQDVAGHDAEIAANIEDQRVAGHWGVPLFSFEGEPFFGQDRIDHLLFRMKQKGLKAR